MEYTIKTTELFKKWLKKLKDPIARRAIPRRISVLQEMDSFGDSHGLKGLEISEMRFHTGKGYRVYYAIRQRTIVILLAGGDKSSQLRDIE